MRKTRKIILLLCLLTIGGFIALQSAWLLNYYDVNRDRFRKDADLAFEAAIRQEFNLRCDTLEKLLVQYLADTTRVRLGSEWSDRYQRHIYSVVTLDSSREKYSFSHKVFNLPVNSPADSAYLQLAKLHARSYRQENLERRIIFYNTQALGAYIGDKVDEWIFDTARLRPLLVNQLRIRNIHEDFRIEYLQQVPAADAVLSLQQQFAAITPAYETYLLEDGRNYVQAFFPSMRHYLANRMKWMLLAAVLLLAAIGFSLFYLFRSLQHQKKLAVIRNDFISNITHEFKTPVAALSGAIEILDSFGAAADPEKNRKYLSISRQELDRLQHMIDRLLQVSLYEKGNTQLNRQRIPVVDMLKQLAERFETRTPSSIQIISAQAGISINADAGLLENAFANIIDNALKYGGPGTGLRIYCWQDGSGVSVKLEDNGPGIEAKYLPYVFDKFFRVPHGDSHPVKGHGIGLYYVKKITELHGGRCLIQSQYGKGTCITIELPNDVE